MTEVVPAGALEIGQGRPGRDRRGVETHDRDRRVQGRRGRDRRGQDRRGRDRRVAPRPVLGIGLVVTASLLFAVNGTVAKLILRNGIDSTALTQLRATGAFLGLLVLCRARGPGWSRLAVSRSELPLLIGYGLAGFFLVPTLYFVAISRLPVGIGLLFEYTAPLLVALWARFGQRQQVKSRLWIGLVASLVGLAAVAQIWRGAAGLNGVGVAAGLCSAVLLAGYYLLGARGVSQRDTLSLTCLAFGVSALVGIVVLPWWRFPYAVLATRAHGIPVAALVVYLICFGSIVSYLLINAALRHLPPTSVGIIGMVEPVIASAVAWIVLGEHLDPAQLAGGVLILIGVTLAETARTVGPGEPAELPPA